MYHNWAHLSHLKRDIFEHTVLLWSKDSEPNKKNLKWLKTMGFLLFASLWADPSVCIFLSCQTCQPVPFYQNWDSFFTDEVYLAYENLLEIYTEFKGTSEFLFVFLMHEKKLLFLFGKSFDIISLYCCLVYIVFLYF